MQHDHVLKKLNFELLTPSPGLGGGGGGGGGGIGVRGHAGYAGKIFASMLLHFMIPFNWICKMTMF